ncbi:MAG: hypothetical protein KJ002_01665 [Candidatus Dadabacteria bacterium]|jgi:hypothetical protein|nr:hypothetical protein [Candidatus Dadabacteria bacterium]
MEQAEESIRHNSEKPGFFSGEKVKVFHSPVFSIGGKLQGVHPAFFFNRNIEAEGFRGEVEGRYRARGDI